MRRAGRMKVNIERAAQVDRIRLNSCFRVLSGVQLTEATALPAALIPKYILPGRALARARAISAMAAGTNELRSCASSWDRL